MLDSVRKQYEAYPDPSPALVPVGPQQLDRIDDGLHYGWAWHRHGFCYRRGAGLKILDAGCGTGLTTLGLSRLNPESKVIGVDASQNSLSIAKERGRAAGAVGEGVEFREHDLEKRLPADWGPFDFIVCRKVLAQAEDPARVLKNLAAALDDRGILYVTFPSRSGRAPVRQFRQAVSVLAGPEASLQDRVAIAADLFQTLRPDHPIRRHEAAYSGAAMPSAERLVAGYLGEAERDWSLVEVRELLENTGLQFLYASTRRPWRADEVLVANTASDQLRKRVDALTPTKLAELIDALHPALHGDEYRAYACLAEFEPRVPAWVEEHTAHPEVINGLVPHLTGLSWPDSATTGPQGRVVYRSVTGAIGEVDRRADLLLRAVDGVSTCGEITARVASQAGSGDGPAAWQARWLDLANAAFVLLEPADARQHIDCRHLGPIIDRLDCACPRRWIRACELHGQCTIAEICPDDEKYAILSDVLNRLKLPGVTACAKCVDYAAEG